MSSGKSKTMPMQIFWGVLAVYYGIVQVENGIFLREHKRSMAERNASCCSDSS